MQHGGKPIKVKLVVDLTRYDSRCTEGSIGKTVPGAYGGLWGKHYDRFVAVKFDNGAFLDVLWSGLRKGKNFDKPAN